LADLSEPKGFLTVGGWTVGFTFLLSKLEEEPAYGQQQGDECGD
jgi:hypothetical protein